MAALRRLRCGPFDIFGHSRERRRERQLIRDYEILVAELIENLDAENHALAVRIADLPDDIRGFGHVKERNIAIFEAQVKDLMIAFHDRERHATAAE